jgi:peptidoglycan/LPS O-acetylase OafA/YrhL
MDIHSEKFNGLDLLRALAIIMVLLYHYRMFGHPEWVDDYARFGWTGVDLFFVLSGFLISKQLFQQIKSANEIRLKDFYIKRFFRIIPPYLIVLAVYFTFPFFREREALPPLLKFITFTQNIGLDVRDFGTFSQVWSLCVEEQFYLLFPLILLLFLKFKKLKYLMFFLCFLLLFTIAARIISYQIFIIPSINTDNFWREWYMKIYYPTYTRLDGLVVGIAIAYCYEYSIRFKDFIHSNGNLLLLSGIVLVAFSFWICNDQTSLLASITGFTFVSLGFGLVVMSAVSKSSVLYYSKSFWLTQLAALSYSIYLSHKATIHISQNLMEKLGIEEESHITLIICLLGCILVGIFFKYVIEKPSVKIKNYLLKN